MGTELTPKEVHTLLWVARYCFFGVVLMCVTLCFVFAKSNIPEYRPIIVSARSVSLNTSYQPSATRYVNVSVSVKVTCTATLTGGQDGTINLQTSPDNGTWTTVATVQNNNSVALAIALTAVNGNTATLSGVVAPNYYYRLQSVSTTGSPSFSIITSSQEVQL